jgi:hypothetical protein
MTLPFTFAWVDEDQTTFNPSTMNVFDERIYNMDLSHDEGQIPTLDLTIRNPRVGLLSPDRKLWAWLAWQDQKGELGAAGTLYPIFFGVLVGVPTDLFKEKITIKLIARSPQFIANKQAVAETMKTAPYYDPVFVETAKRDDPDTILEGWSALWHIDRTTLAITASDVLIGEDGTETFYESDALYNSVSLQLDQPPLANIRVVATVNWRQRSSGYISVPQFNISSYTGESLISDWPKPGANIGGGYKCEASFVSDTYFVSQTPTASFNAEYTNDDPHPGQCDDASGSQSSSGPALLSPDPLVAVLTSQGQTGVCDPFSDPPINRPMLLSASGIIVPLWNVSMDMTMRYDSSRQFSEVLAFDMTANTQAILASPTVSQNTELLTISSVDVSEPLIEVDAWTDFTNAHVPIATIIFPNNPTKPGGLSFQIAVASGTAGAVEPTFSDIVGFTTNDNGVVWASMGQTPLTNAPAWPAASYVPLGMIILMQDRVFNTFTGEYESVPGAISYYLATRPGKTNDAYTEFAYQPPVSSNVEAPPALRHISDIAPPIFSTTVGAQIVDGSVTWTVLGTSPSTLGIPIGGTPDNVTARFYFPTPRGLRSTEYLISRGRARLRWRARAVKVSWQCHFARVVAMSCRKNATLFDPRFPGGAATGKVISYRLSASSKGVMRGQVTIGCSVGLGDSIAEITGTPVYAAAGYMQKGYQRYTGAMVAHGSNDTTYSLPVSNGFDDGLKFPLRWDDISDGGLISGNLADQKAAIEQSFQTMLNLQWLSSFGGIVGNTTSHVSGRAPDAAWKLEREQLALITQNTPFIMNANSISLSFLLKPCAGNGPFGGSYEITVSPLVLPEGINLLALSSP